MSTPRIDLNTVTDPNLRKQLEALYAENDALKAKQAAKIKPLDLKIGEKGGVCVTGLNGRFPVTLYAAQWLRLLDFADQIKAFIGANKAKLAWKD